MTNEQIKTIAQWVADTAWGKSQNGAYIVSYDEIVKQFNLDDLLAKDTEEIAKIIDDMEFIWEVETTITGFDIHLAETTYQQNKARLYKNVEKEWGELLYNFKDGLKCVELGFQMPSFFELAVKQEISNYIADFLDEGYDKQVAILAKEEKPLEYIYSHTDICISERISDEISETIYDLETLKGGENDL